MGNAQEISADEEGSVELHGLASWWRSGPEWDAALAEVEAEDEPAQLNTANSAGGFNLVSLDKLSVRYPGHPHHAYDVGAVQADRPAPARRLLYYFEMTVDHAGAKGLLAIGFTPPGVKMCRQPGSVALHRERASELEHSTVFQFFCFRLRQLEHPTVFQFFCLEFWEENSCGYRGDDGMIYRGQETGESFGPTFAAGDTVGAGINYAAQEFFFTKNGHLVGAVAKNAKGPLFPTVAVHSQNEQVTVNFGKHPFLFNIEAYALEERTKQLSAIEKSILPVNVSQNEQHALLFIFTIDIYGPNECFVPWLSKNKGFGCICPPRLVDGNFLEKVDSRSVLNELRLMTFCLPQWRDPSLTRNLAIRPRRKF
ncbi:ran-binding protein M homolog isoform X1 [Wolffia australiana]